MAANKFGAFVFALLLLGMVFPTTVIVNSLDHKDIISSAVYAKAYGGNFAFALDPKQSVFIAGYYTATPNEPIIYLEGKQPVLANMEAIIRDAGVQNLTVVRGRSLQEFVADAFPKERAIIVGSQYGQDALSIAPYAALTKSPLYFIGEGSDAQAVLDSIKAKGYGSVLIYGSVARQIPQSLQDALPQKKVIDTGNRYSNNLQAVSEFLKVKYTTQVMFVSGKTFEKSMVDTNYPLVLAGRSDVLSETSQFIKDNGITAGVVFVGDEDIVDGVTKLRAQVPSLSLFAKFGEGFTGSKGGNVPQPLQIYRLPSPEISLELINMSYNIPLKAFSLRVKNTGDFAALSAGLSVPGVGSSDSLLVLLDPGTETSIAIPMDASSAISGGKIAQGTLTARYGEDTRLLDNIDTVTYKDIPVSDYKDSSSVSLGSIVYNPETKAFEVAFDGDGYVEGTIRFSINEVPVTIRIPNSKISGPTAVSIKYLLSQDEQNFIDSLPADYSFRYGAKPDVLLFESRGTIKTTIKSSIIPSLPGSGAENGAGGQNDGGFPWIIAIIAVIIAVAAFAFLKMKKGGSGEFE